ncbi:MAG: metallophosphoesterase, partial [bacterium]|nr:metallophosphoesterase [bacterium]MDY4100643.1 metallophosphoesterase [Lachnospiraceae bacterium]
MSFIFKIIVAAALLLIIYVIWQVQELKHFRITRYEICSEKLVEEHQWVVVSDLHLWQYGDRNEQLIGAIREQEPQAIFIPGDLIVHTEPELFYIAEDLMEQLTEIAPVYVSNGNHESRLEDPSHNNYTSYQKLKKRMLELGVHLLNNEKERVQEGADEIIISGLELPLSYYKKGVDTPLAPDELTRCLGEADTGHYQILLAHTPKYVPEYFAWGADLCLSGHYHGGRVCIPGIGSI